MFLCLSSIIFRHGQSALIMSVSVVFCEKLTNILDISSMDLWSFEMLVMTAMRGVYRTMLPSLSSASIDTISDVPVIALPK